MSSDRPIRLASAGLVELAGPDAVAFAQAQFSSDITRLQPGSWHWSAWLDPQGRARNVFALLRPDAQRLLAWLPLGDARAMSEGLARFKFRSKLTIDALQDWQLLCDTPSTVATTDLHRHEYGDGWGLDLPGAWPRRAILVPETAVHAIPSDADGHALNEFRLADIAAGLPFLVASLSGEFVAAALGLERLGATSLDKGCYPGQEIVARLHYRGGNKRRCCRVRIATDVVPVPGDVIVAGDPAAQHGTILHAAQSDTRHCEALAVVSGTIETQGALRLASGARIIALSPEFDMAQ